MGPLKPPPPPPWVHKTWRRKSWQEAVLWVIIGRGGGCLQILLDTIHVVCSLSVNDGAVTGKGEVGSKLDPGAKSLDGVRVVDCHQEIPPLLF